MVALSRSDVRGHHWWCREVFSLLEAGRVSLRVAVSLARRAVSAQVLSGRKAECWVLRTHYPAQGITKCVLLLLWPFLEWLRDAS